MTVFKVNLKKVKNGTYKNGKPKYKNVKMLSPVESWGDYLDLRNTPTQINLLHIIMQKAEACKDKDIHTLKDAVRKEKGKLLEFCYSCMPNEDGTLAQTKTESNSVVMDIDDIAEADLMPLAAKIRCMREEVKLLLLEKSASGRGLHLVFWRNPELSQVENLQHVADKLGVKFDAGATDITRVIYTTPTESAKNAEDYLLCVDKRNLFKNSADDEYEAGKEFVDSEKKEFRDCIAEYMAKLEEEKKEVEEKRQEQAAHDEQVREAMDGFDFDWGFSGSKSKKKATESKKKSTGKSTKKDADDPWDEPIPEGLESLEYDGIPYQEYIQEWFKQVEQEGGPKVGMRNTVLSKLAFALRSMTDNNCQLMLAIIPNYGLSDKEMRGIITSAHNSKEDFYITKDMQKAIDNVQKQHKDEEDEDCGLAPRMPEKLPPLIEHLVSNTPEIYKPAVAHAVFPALATHLWQTRFEYIDGVEHEATLMNVLMAGTGSGKDCITKPIRYIMRDIEERDGQSRQKENEWQKAMRKCSAKKEKPERPEGIVVQMIHSDTTNPAFIQRLQEADGRFLYCQMNEIELFDSLQKQGAKNAQFQIMKLAFDPDNNYGQERYSTDGLCGSAQIRFNWNASTTIQQGQRYFRMVLTDGPISRINFCTIPEQPIGAAMPVFGKYGADFAEKLRPYIENLNNARGLIECTQATALARKLDQEVKKIAIETQDRVYENLSHRANVIAYLKAMVLFVASGGQWNEVTEDFIRWSLHYDLWCKMQFFGDAIRKIEETPVFDGLLGKKVKKGPKGLLNSLPLEFSYGQLLEVREKLGKSNDKAKVMDQLRKWRERGAVEPVVADAAENREMWDKTKWRQLNRV